VVKALDLIMYESRSKKPHGFTLVEMLVVLAILGVISAVSATGITRSASTHNQPITTDLQAATRRAVRSGTVASAVLRDSTGKQLALVLPDGRVVMSGNWSSK
jgi:prepilin-type N-terminal cleavage/methylation domain-containing protein